MLFKSVSWKCTELFSISFSNAVHFTFFFPLLWHYYLNYLQQLFRSKHVCVLHLNKENHSQRGKSFSFRIAAGLWNFHNKLHSVCYYLLYAHTTSGGVSTKEYLGIISLTHQSLFRLSTLPTRLCETKTWFFVNMSVLCALMRIYSVSLHKGCLQGSLRV